MKKILMSLLFIVTVQISAQEIGSIAGTLTDKEVNNEPLPFANILIKGITENKHFGHVSNIYGCPGGNISIECKSIPEHGGHGSHTAHIPIV